MDINKLIARIKNILLTPKTEWPVIAAETDTVAGLYKNYIIYVAALTPVATFIGLVLFGIHVPFMGTIHIGFFSALTQMILGYAVSLGVCYVMALIINALAPSFGGTADLTQALKAAAYSYTAVWVVGVLHILPGLGFLVGLLVLAAAIYSIYLMYLGLQHTMKSPQNKAGGYTAVVIIIGIVLGWILAIVVGMASGVSAMTSGALLQGSSLSESSPSFTPDKNSAIGALAAIGQQAQQASQKMDAAQKSGDANAQAAAATQMLGAVLGGGDKVEALAPDVLKPFVPDTLAGMKRNSMSVQRNGAMGMQVSEAEGQYGDGNGHNLHLEINDLGGAKGVLAMVGWAGVEADQETDHGYDKTYRQGGRLIHEQWNSQSKSGEYGLVLGDRFSVKVSGNADSVDQLKSAVASLNLAGLEALKNQGVQKN